MSNDNESTSLLRTTNKIQHEEASSKATGSGFSVVHQWMKPLMGVCLGLLLGTFLGSNNIHHSSSSHQSTSAHGTQPQPLRGGASVSSITSRYTQFQALNYQLYTGGAPVDMPDKAGGSKKKNPECSSDLTLHGTMGGDEYCYMGYENVTLDIESRLSIVEEAMERAYTLANHTNDILKVFVAPEFLFRGRNGAYIVPTQEGDDEGIFPLFVQDSKDGKCHAEVCHILTGLERLVADARYQDWIFLFGTTILSETLPVEDRFDYLFYNFGMLYKGYDPAKENGAGKQFLVPKRYVSNLDFLTPHRYIMEHANTQEVYESAKPQREDAATAAKNTNSDHKEPTSSGGQLTLQVDEFDNSNVVDDDDAPPPRRRSTTEMVLSPHDLNHKQYDRKIWRMYKEELAKLNYEMIEYGWLQLDGITFSVEICLDHDMRVALTAFLIDSVLPTPTLIPSSQGGGTVEYVPMPRHQAQLSIVSSAGMIISPTSLVLADQGSIILQDGMNGDEELNMTWGYECFKYGWEFAGGSEVVKRNATMTPTEVVFHYEVHDGYTKHGVYDPDDWKSNLRNVFSTAMYEPMIVVFDPAPIAPVQD